MTEVSRPPEYANTTFLTGASPWDMGSAILQKPNKNGLLHMQPIFSLIEDHGVRAIQDSGRDFLPTMGRQAMHDDGIGFGGGQ